MTHESTFEEPEAELIALPPLLLLLFILVLLLPGLGKLLAPPIFLSFAVYINL